MLEEKEKLLDLSEIIEEEEEEEEAGDDGGDGGDDGGDDKDKGGDDDDELFNPFADLDEDDKDKGKDDDEEDDDGEDGGDDGGEDGKDKGKDKKTIVKKVIVQDSEGKEANATIKASREVRKFIKDNPDFEEFEDEMIDIASKASLKGYEKPVEFAIRNVKNPKFWIAYGKKLANEDVPSVRSTKIGGLNARKEGGVKEGYFKNMDSDKFNAFVENIKRSA